MRGDVERILSPANRELLAQVASSNVLFAFDFDGTLAPIVADREAAAMRARTRRLLGALAELRPSAVLSGRARSDVAARLAGVPVRYVVGNHGLEDGEQGRGMARFERSVASMLPCLGAALEGWAGVELEDKRYSIAVHYRKSRAKRAALAAILRAIAELEVPTRTLRGTLVVNVLPEGAPHKGIALRELRARARADTALFVGDDASDEDVFELDEPGRLLGVRVGLSRSSAAPFYIREQGEIDVLLAELVRASRSVAR